MKNWLRILIVAVVASVALAGCNTSKSTVSNHANLNQYEYASVVNDDTYYLPAELMKYEIQMFDAVEASGLRLIGYNRIYEFAPEKKDKLLLVKYGVTQTDGEAIVTVNFIDYMTGRPVASCQGAYGLGLTRDGDLQGAIKKVTKQISETFRR